MQSRSVEPGLTAKIEVCIWFCFFYAVRQLQVETVDFFFAGRNLFSLCSPLCLHDENLTFMQQQSKRLQTAAHKVDSCLETFVQVTLGFSAGVQWLYEQS